MARAASRGADADNIKLLGSGEHRVHADGAELGAVDLRFVAEAEVATGFRGAGVIAEDDDFDVGMKERPALQRVALNGGDTIAKRFSGGEDGEHGLFGKSASSRHPG